MRGKIFAVAILFLVLAVAGCTQKQSAQSPQDTKEIGVGTDEKGVRVEIDVDKEPPKVEKKIFPDQNVAYTVNNTSVINTGELEKEIHKLINVERFKLGLSVMEWDAHLSFIGREHSRDMASRNYFEHDDPEGRNFVYRYENNSYECSIVIATKGDIQETATGGENLYLTHLEQRDWYKEKDGVKTYVRSDFYTQNEIAVTTVQGWMNSTKHYENIVRPYWKNEGIGVAIAEDHTIYVTQNFC